MGDREYKGKIAALEFDIDFDRKQPVPMHVGYLMLGKGDFRASLILMPDGLHIRRDAEALGKFVHLNAGTSIQFAQSAAAAPGVQETPDNNAQDRTDLHSDF